LDVRDVDEVTQKLQHWKKQVYLPLNILFYVVEGRGTDSEKRVLLEYWRVRLAQQDLTYVEFYSIQPLSAPAGTTHPVQELLFTQFPVARTRLANNILRNYPY
jgi:hypothetical protein